jgi:hypothetical protein
LMSPKKEPVIIKETWEIEAEQGLLTEGGRRRARLAAAAATDSSDDKHHAESAKDTQSIASTAPQSPQLASTFSLAKYYVASIQTLTLPPSAPPPKVTSHTRAFSVTAFPSRVGPPETDKGSDLALPAPTLPLALITSQSFSQTLRVLVLNSRRADRSLSLPADSPSSDHLLLPNLEELTLENCDLRDFISVSRASGPDSGATTPPRSSEPLLPLLTKCFPTLRTLDLSGNGLTSASLNLENLSALIMASPPHGHGLRHLRLRGNRLTELDGLQTLAQSFFKGNRHVPEWKLEELDLRDNEIGKLPPELGLLPLEIFLVDGNT